MGNKIGQKFSILIPSVNNPQYLKICLDSLKKNSNAKHQILVFASCYKPNFIQNLKFQFKNIEIINSSKKVGLCSAINILAKKAKYNALFYSHDDMYFCPNWDFYFFKELKKIKTKKFFLSSTLIEKKGKAGINFDCGDNYKSFNEKKLLKYFKKLDYYNTQGSHYAPHLIHKALWRKINGFSEEFNPGFGSDPDLNMKLWNSGVRIFKGINLSRVYHFGSITMNKTINNKRSEASKKFLLKWGITIKFFFKHYMQKNNTYKERLPEKLKKDFLYYAELLICKIIFLYYFLIRKLKN